MSDALCGPSNALKRLGDHADRDRSAHQDRFVNTGPIAPSFRSAPQPTASGDQAFENFQAGASLPAVQPNGALEGLILRNGGGFVANQPIHHAPSTAVTSGWAQEFMTMNSAGPQAARVAAAPEAARFMSATPQNLLQARPNFAPVGHMPLRFQHHGMGNVGPAHGLGGHAQVSYHHQPDPQQQTALPAEDFSQEAFEAAFRQHDADVDFQNEMDLWMAQHGPGVAESAAAEEQEVEDNMRQMADEMDSLLLEREREREAERERERHEDGELRRTAQDIVASIGSNERFQASRFVALMREITEGQVVLDKERSDLVDAQTNMPISDRVDGADAADPEDGDAQTDGTAKGKGRADDSSTTATSSPSVH